ncbi:uncharacterized protein LOC114259426 [Camellia sinensis]|uniref:uncharacterized protein LOC114259426 n=1 Tax=Camellia sinensis TaxID=4442 RepID=UPI001035538E|nr:uncharacterized protein LOC114259426 [Camellia sinensis]
MTVGAILSSSEARHNHGCSKEEKDHLIRSTKKIKGISDSADDGMEVQSSVDDTQGKANPNLSIPEEPMLEASLSQKKEIRSEAPPPPMEGQSDQVRSFKQALLCSRFNECGNEKNFDCDVETLSSDEDDLANDTGPEDHMEINEGNRAGGPWVVLDHYVTVRKWQQDFKSDEAEEDTTAIWVRFPNLPIEYYDEKVLYHIAKILGVPLKVDINTAMAARGKYARVCVEVDLRKPLISQFSIGKYTYVIEYEHLHTLYFSCGRVGHRKESCSENFSPVTTIPNHNPTREENLGKEATINGLDSCNGRDKEGPETDKYGPWMKATTRRRRQGQKNSKGPNAHVRNKFEVLSNVEAPPRMIEAQDPSRSIPTGPDQADLGLTHKEQSAKPADSMANLGSSSDLNMDNWREEIRQGKQQSCITATSFQKLEQEVRESMSSILIPISPRTS